MNVKKKKPSQVVHIRWWLQYAAHSYLSWESIFELMFVFLWIQQQTLSHSLVLSSYCVCVYVTCGLHSLQKKRCFLYFHFRYIETSSGMAYRFHRTTHLASSSSSLLFIITKFRYVLCSVPFQNFEALYSHVMWTIWFPFWSIFRSIFRVFCSFFFIFSALACRIFILLTMQTNEFHR